ncbi:molybdopterin oxidoreductase family protein [Mycobacterium sherrisii]|uniref:molybdopterin oxidoreductase family protein n=1 Tax=Mycobacterium sherrisii TaxID=243061 RepID=UPI0039755044
MAPVPTKTHCPYCSLQCGITLEVSQGDIELAPQSDFPTNRGGLCAKGWTAADLLGHPERLTSPLIRDRRGAELRPASWNEALERIVAAFGAAQEHHGRDAVGCFGGGGLTNEKAYQLGKFARVALRTSAIDYNGRGQVQGRGVRGRRVILRLDGLGGQCRWGGLLFCRSVVGGA